MNHFTAVIAYRGGLCRQHWDSGPALVNGQWFTLPRQTGVTEGRIQPIE